MSQFNANLTMPRVLYVRDFQIEMKKKEDFMQQEKTKYWAQKSVEFQQASVILMHTVNDTILSRLNDGLKGAMIDVNNCGIGLSHDKKYMSESVILAKKIFERDLARQFVDFQVNDLEVYDNNVVFNISWE